MCDEFGDLVVIGLSLEDSELIRFLWTAGLADAVLGALTGGVVNVSLVIDARGRDRVVLAADQVLVPELMLELLALIPAFDALCL